MEEVEFSLLWGQPCWFRRDTGNLEAIDKSDELGLDHCSLLAWLVLLKSQQMETRLDWVVQWLSWLLLFFLT